MTNGHLYYYQKFKIELHHKSLYNQIQRTLNKFNVTDVIMKTRYSKGAINSEYVTPVLINNEDCINMANLDWYYYRDILIKVKLLI